MNPENQDGAARVFLRESTTLVAPPLLPELSLWLATEVTPLWRATEAWLAEKGIEPPFWAFAWAGGQALARFLLDRPELVRGKTVLDIAAGSGLAAIAAAKSGARRVVAVDKDPLAAVAIAMNAEQNNVVVEAHAGDILGVEPLPLWAGAPEVVLAGDVCYDAAMTRLFLPWLARRAETGAAVYLGDPGRAYLPQEGLEEVGRFRVPTIDDVEAESEKVGIVHRLRGHPPKAASLP